MTASAIIERGFQICTMSVQMGVNVWRVLRVEVVKGCGGDLVGQTQIN